MRTGFKKLHSGPLLWTATLALLLLVVPHRVAADINLRISVKFILSPGGAMPCCGNGSFDSFADITNQVNFANEMLRSFGRGYQFQIYEVTTVGGPASAFFSNSRDDKDLLEAAAEADKTGFKYRDNAVNMYVNDANGSAVCSFPPTDDIILFGQSSRTTSLGHESGHYFNLQHTHAGADIVLLQTGNYNEPQTITKAVTLRATRGDAIIGKP